MASMPRPQPIPDGYRRVTPALVVDDAPRALDFYAEVYGATERMRVPGPGGAIAHAEIEIGDSVVMFSDQFEQSTCKPPTELGGTSAALCLYVEDVDAVVEQAVNAGATVTMPVEDMFWGDRFGKLADPFGHEWQVATHVEDLTPEEIMERGKEAMAGLS
jgi:PhnB protein